MDERGSRKDNSLTWINGTSAIGRPSNEWPGTSLGSTLIRYFDMA